MERRDKLKQSKFTSLLISIKKECLEEIKELLIKIPTLLLLRDKNGRSALHYCAEHKSASCANYLISSEKDLLNAQDNDGYTALHLSVISGNETITKLLVSKGDINYLNACDNEKHTAIHWATVCGEINCLQILIEAGANPSTPDIHGAYPIHYCAQMCSPHSGICIENDSNIGLAVLHKLLQSGGVDVNCADNDGRTPLLWAASAGKKQLLCLYIDFMPSWLLAVKFVCVYAHRNTSQ